MFRAPTPSRIRSRAYRWFLIACGLALLGGFLYLGIRVLQRVLHAIG
ncbi:MAG: hypothetical protein U1D55_06735 [Phycisphaerae bacterium]